MTVWVRFEPGKFICCGRCEMPSVSRKPIVQRPMVFKLERADGMGDAFDGVRRAVREIVHRIDAPLVAGAVMGGAENAVHHGVAHVEVGGSHVDLGPQGAGAVREFSRAHTREEVEVLLNGSVAVRTFFAGLGQRASIFPDLVAR